MKINRANLLTALEIVKPGLANKDLIEQSTSFAFMGDRIVTYNDDISISHPIQGLELQGAIKAEKLYQILGKLKQEEISLEISTGEIVLKSGRAKAGLAIQAEIKLPLEEEVAYKEKWKTLPKKFVEAVSMTMGSAAKSMTRPILTCVNIRKDGVVESSDNYRVMQYNMKEEMPIETILLPVSAAVVMVKLLPNKIAKGKGWIHFKNEEGTILSCRVFSDKFPDTTLVMEGKGTKFVFPEAVKDLIERVSVFAKRDHMLDEVIHISMYDGKLKMRGESDTEWFEETIKMDFKGDETSFYITPYLLKSIVSQTNSGILAKGKLKFKGDNWTYVAFLKTPKKEE